MKFTTELRSIRKKLATLERKKERLKASRRNPNYRDKTIGRINDEIFGVMDRADELLSVIAILEAMQSGKAAAQFCCCRLCPLKSAERWRSAGNIVSI